MLDAAYHIRDRCREDVLRLNANIDEEYEYIESDGMEKG